MLSDDIKLVGKLIYCQLQTWERVHVTPASENNVIDTGKADFLAVHVEFSSKWNMKKSSRLFYQRMIRQNKIDFIIVCQRQRIAVCLGLFFLCVTY